MNFSISQKAIFITISHVGAVYLKSISNLRLCSLRKIMKEGVNMNYVSVAIIKPSASKVRLRALITDLQTVDCLVKVDQKRWLLEFEIPEDMLCWLRAGGLSGVFTKYPDVVHWTKPFREARTNEVKALPVQQDTKPRELRVER
jgi:hypothetical protein